MKYIKLFEDLNNGYEKVSSGEIPDYIYEFIDFDDSQIAKLNKLGFESSNVEYEKKCFEVDYLQILRMPDEWYYIQDDDDDDEMVYKCDQWDGLLNCLRGEYEISDISVE